MTKRSISSHSGSRGMRDVVIAMLLVLLSPLLLPTVAFADLVSGVTVIAVPGSPVSVAQDPAASTSVTPDAAVLSSVAANLPVPSMAVGEAVTRYVAADSAGASGVIDVTKLGADVERVRYTSMSPAGVQTMQLNYEVSNVGADGWVVQLADNNAQTASFAVAAGFCSSNCNLLSGIASSIVSLGCGAAAIVGGLPTGGAGAYVVLAGCTRASGAAGYVVADNCTQSTLCVPRVTQNRFICYPLTPGCHSEGNVTSSPAVDTNRIVNDSIYGYYNSPLFYFRQGTNTTGGSYTVVQEISNSNGVYFYLYSSDFQVHSYACPPNSQITAQVVIAGGKSPILSTHLQRGCL